MVLCLALIGLWITIRSAAPPPPATVSVLTATRDLPAGRALTSDDLRVGNWPAGHVPSGRLTMAVGRTLASPIRAGELLTDARVVGPGLLTGQPLGTVAMPVRLGDPAAGALVRAGDRVDVLVSSSTSAATWSAEPDLADGTDSPGPGTTDTGTKPDSDPDPGSGSSSGSGSGSGTTGTDAGSDSGPDSNSDTNGSDTTDPDTEPDAGSGSNAGSGAGTDTGAGSNGSGTGTTGSSGRSGAEPVVAGALVLAAPGAAAADDSGLTGSTGTGLSGLAGGALTGTTPGDTSTAGMLVLAVSSREATKLAAVQSASYLTIAVLPQH